MPSNVEITFDCLPLRSVTRFDIPLDASPEFRALCERVKRAADKHGLHNSYYLHNARCVYHLTNDPQLGMIELPFEGTVLTDAEDRHATNADLIVKLRRETCDWLTESVVDWFRETVRRAVMVDFDRFAASGDLERTKQRLEKIDAEMEAQGGFLGMGL